MSNQSQRISHSSSNSNINSNLNPNSNTNQRLNTMGVQTQRPTESTSDGLRTTARTVDNNQLETVINNYTRICQSPHNGHRQWLNQFYDLMKSEWTRLRSFYARNDAKWALDYVTPEELANAGFFFLNGDRVQCAFCRGIVSNWEPGDRPLAEHARHFPRCPFIMEEDVGNQPINDDPMRGIKRGYDVCGNFTASQLHSIGINNRNNSSAEMREYGVQPHRGPKHTNYSSLESRRRSYLTNGWDPNVPISIDSLAEAGFFSIGMQDYVKCFYCDGGLCNWELGDDPWIEHAKWFPECNFVQLNKTPAFIDACKKLAEKERQKMNAQNESELQTNMGSDNEDFDNDVLGIRAVNEWMNSDIVRELMNLNAFSEEVIKAVLNRRWRLTKQPFATFSELYDAVSQWRNQPTSQSNLVIPSTERQISHESNSSNDEDYHSGSEIPSSQSSISSTTSTFSNYSSSPEATKELIISGSPKTKDNPFVCKICYERDIGVVFLPCGHQMACTQCAACVTDCPICRKVIRGTVRTFFS